MASVQELGEFKAAKNLFLELKKSERAAIISRYGRMSMKDALLATTPVQCRIFFKLLFGPHRDALLEKVKQLSEPIAS